MSGERFGFPAHTKQGMFQTSTPIAGNLPNLSPDSDSAPAEHQGNALPPGTSTHNPNGLFNGSYLHHRNQERFGNENKTPLSSDLRFTSSNSFATAQSKPQKVFFSPTKEVITYDKKNGMDEYSVVLASMEESKTPSASGFSKILSVFADPRVPYVLSLYLQLFFNAVVVSVVMYFMYIFVSSVRSDVLNKVDVYTSDAMQQISYCSREYYRNKCTTDGPTKPAPALERSCMEWEKCMNRDPQKIGKSKITAELFAEILNGFLQPISWKSLALVCILILGSIVTTNVAFVVYRRKSGLDDFGVSQRVQELEHKLQATLRNVKHMDQVLATSTPPTADFLVEGKDPSDDSILQNSSPLSRKNSRRNGR